MTTTRITMIKPIPTTRIIILNNITQPSTTITEHIPATHITIIKAITTTKITLINNYNNDNTNRT